VLVVVTGGGLGFGELEFKGRGNTGVRLIPVEKYQSFWTHQF